MNGYYAFLTQKRTFSLRTVTIMERDNGTRLSPRVALAFWWRRLPSLCLCRFHLLLDRNYFPVARALPPVENIFSSNALDSSQAEGNAGWNVRVPLTFSVVIDVAGVMASMRIPSETQWKNLTRPGGYRCAEILFFSKIFCKQNSPYEFCFHFFPFLYHMYALIFFSFFIFFFRMKGF